MSVFYTVKETRFVRLQVGNHNEKRASYGHSVVYDPWGDLVGELDGENPGVLVAEVASGAVAERRARMPVAAHREKGRGAVAGPMQHVEWNGD